MEKLEKLKEAAISSNILTKESFSSLRKAEDDLETTHVFLDVILPAVRNKEASVEIRPIEGSELKSAIVILDKEVIFSTQDQGEVEALDLVSKGENLVINPSTE